MPTPEAPVRNRLNAMTLLLLLATLVLIGMAAPAADAAFPGERGRIAFSAGTPRHVQVMHFNGTDVTELVPGSSPAYSPDGTRIAFVRGSEDSREIFLMNANGSGVAQLTDNNRADFAPAFSPDGSKIAFASNRAGAQGSDPSIWMMDSDGSDAMQLTSGEDDDPSFFPDGATIAFTRGTVADRNIRVVGADGTGEAGLVTSPLHFDAAPTVSPDGTRVAHRRGSEIRVMDADGGNASIIGTAPSGTLSNRPAFSPHGGGVQLAFESNRDGRAIWRMNADGSNEVRLADGIEPDWGPAPPPRARINSGPSGVVSSTTAVFTYSAPETLMAGPADEFLCRLEGSGPFAPCPPGIKSFSGLSDGQHTFQLVARNDTGTGPLTERTWTVDTSLPETEITKGPKRKLKASKKRAKAKFKFASSQEDSSFECKLQGKRAPASERQFGECTSPKRYKLRRGRYTFKVRAVNSGGNPDPTPAKRKLRVVGR